MECYQRKVQLIREASLKERATGVTKTNTLRARLLKTSLWGPHHTIMCLQMLYDLTFAMLDFDLVWCKSSCYSAVPIFLNGNVYSVSLLLPIFNFFLIRSKLRVCCDPLKNLRTSKQHC